MTNFIIVGVVVVIIALAGFYLWRAKKRGQTCIGCPYAKLCDGKCGGHQNDEDDHKE